MTEFNFPKDIFSGSYKTGHCQGIAVDAERGYVYYSFTTILVKTDLDGRFIGSVSNLAGHLGCITYDRERTGAKEIFFACFTEEDVMNPDAVIDVTIVSKP